MRLTRRCDEDGLRIFAHRNRQLRHIARTGSTQHAMKELLTVGNQSTGGIKRLNYIPPSRRFFDLAPPSKAMCTDAPLLLQSIEDTEKRVIDDELIGFVHAVEIDTITPQTCEAFVEGALDLVGPHDLGMNVLRRCRAGGRASKQPLLDRGRVTKSA